MQQRNTPADPCRHLVADQKEQDVVVMDNIATHPAINDVYVTDCLLIIICHQGTIFSVDAAEERLQTHDVSILMPDQNLLPVQVSADLCCTNVAVSREFYKQFVVQYPYMRYDDLFRRRPPCHLNEEQFANVCDAVKLLRTISRSTSPYRQEQLLHLLSILYNMLGEYHLSNYPDERKGRHVVFNKFYEALVKHHCSSHEMAFYARICCLSPKHFSEVIKAETSISANEWISTFITTCAKSLLVSRKDHTIQQISNIWGLANRLRSHAFSNARRA